MRNGPELFQLLQHAEKRISLGIGSEVSGVQDRGDAVRRPDGTLRGAAAADRADDLAVVQQRPEGAEAGQSLRQPCVPAYDRYVFHSGPSAHGANGQRCAERRRARDISQR